jgi:hypothetical protein
MEWQQIVEFLGGATVFGSVIAYLGKTAIDAYVNGRVEAYKADLQRLTTEHSVRFQRLHSERAEVIKELYTKLVQVDESLHSTLRAFQQFGEPALNDKVAQLSVQFNELRSYYLPRRIFFAEPLCTLIDSTLDTAKSIFIDITTYEVDPKSLEYVGDRGALLGRREYWEKARATYKEEFSQVRAHLETQFRVLLGIEA